MNAVLLLGAVLLVVGSSVAREHNQNDANRERRALKDFQTQINDATYTGMNITGSSACSTPPCTNVQDVMVCGGICNKEQHTLQISMDFYQQYCVAVEVCDKNVVNVTLTNVNISIASGSYPGSCYLYGDVVKMTLSNQSSLAKVEGGNTDLARPFVIDVNLQYTFEPLTVRCVPLSVGSGSCPTSASQSAMRCCGSSLLNLVVCLVQSLVSSLGLNLNLLGCNCNCVGVGGRRDVEVRQPGGADLTFQTQINVIQTEIFSIYIVFASPADAALANNNVNTQVNFVGPPPTQYADDITNGIQMAFNDYNTFYALQKNYFDIISGLEWDLFTTTCGYCQE